MSRPPVRIVDPMGQAGDNGSRAVVSTSSLAPLTTSRRPGNAPRDSFPRRNEASGFGRAAPTTSTKAPVNLRTLDEKLGDLLEPGKYKWGILLVRVSPYQRVQFMGQAHTFRFDRSGNNTGGGSGSSSGGGQNSGE